VVVELDDMIIRRVLLQSSFQRNLAVKLLLQQSSFLSGGGVL
jgi:hypothetical protein